MDPWKVEDIKIVDIFGCRKIDKNIIDRFERLTGHKAHTFLKRNIFFAHRDLDNILNLYESGKKFYLYTGRGPSSISLHLGHLIPLIFCQWLQKVFDVPVVIQITDDEKMIWKNITYDQVTNYSIENIKDIISIGFDVNKTFIFKNTEYISNMYLNIISVEQKMNINQCKKIFGFNDDTCISKLSFPSKQLVPCISNTFKNILDDDMYCLIPCAIDQDPYFRVARNVLKCKPSCIYSSFLPSLNNYKLKMSASDTSSSIYLNDSDNIIKKKIKSAFSGTKSLLEEHRKVGADLNIDTCFIYLTYFLKDEIELDMIREQYQTGKMLSSEIKEKTYNIITEIVYDIRIERNKIDINIVNQFMKIRYISI